MSSINQIDYKGTVYDICKPELDSKADKDSSIASAEQLLSSIYTPNDSPYLYRPTPADSDRERVKRLEGLSVGWNQLVQNIHSTSTKNEVTATNNGDGTVTLSGTATDITAIEITTAVPMRQNHIYYVGKGSNFTLYDGYQADGTGGLSKWNRADNETIIYALIASGTTVNEKIHPQCIDLTTLFGSTIADHIYTLEQATEGSGVAWVKQYIDLDSYHAYSAPTIKSVEGLEAHVMRDADDNIIGNYPLDSTITLRGIPKLVDGKLVADGDWYEPSGNVTVRYGERAYQSGDESLADAITDGTTTVYKLTTPTISTASPYAEVEICDGNGTEEFVTDSPVPVGHLTEYTADLRRQVENIYGIPKPPTTNGNYKLALTVSGGTPTYSWVSDS